MTRRPTAEKTMTEAQAQREREARVYDAMARLCKLSGGIGSMTISTGKQSVTIDSSSSARMVKNAKDVARMIREAGK